MIEKWKSKDVLKNINYTIINQKQCSAYTVNDERIVYVSERGVVDEELCYDFGYKVYEGQYCGGVMVSERGDIGIANFGKLNNSFSKDFCEYFTKWLVDKGLNAVYVENDILVDGYKVVGCGARTHSNITYSVIHIGINTNIYHIIHICRKPMVKVPKGLSEYGITTEEVEQSVLAFFSEYQK